MQVGFHRCSSLQIVGACLPGTQHVVRLERKANEPNSVALVLDAYPFGSTKTLDRFLRTLDLIEAARDFSRRFVVSQLGWASDTLLEEWRSRGWGQIVVYPRPDTIASLSAVRLLLREGDVVIFPHLPTAQPKNRRNSNENYQYRPRA